MHVAGVPATLQTPQHLHAGIASIQAGETCAPGDRSFRAVSGVDSSSPALRVLESCTLFVESASRSVAEACAQARDG